MKKLAIPLLFLIGASAITIRGLLDSRYGNGVLLYLLVPFAISIGLFLFTKESRKQGVGWGYLNHMRFATIIFLATSGILFEGFICILMFMPIYYLIVSIGYLAMWASLGRGKDKYSGMRVFAIPTVIILLSGEGLIPATTVPRYNEASFSVVTDQGIATLQANMAAPIRFDADRSLFLSLFPLPDQIQAGSLRAGDVHRLHFTYKKWLFANYQQGEMDIRIAKVSPRHIQTEIIRNTAYLSHYMKIDGTDVMFDPLPDGRTRVSLTVKYHRLLDPAWYFGPMQKAAARQSARYLVENIIIRQPGSQNYGT